MTRTLYAQGNLPATNQLSLAIGLPLHDPAGLDAFLKAVYDPHSPNYRHFLTPQEFAARFGPTAKDYAAVEKFARTNGFAVTKTYPNRLLVDVRASVARIQNAFHLKLRTYRRPGHKRTFFAPSANPTVSPTLPMADVSGLNDFFRPQPKAHLMKPGQIQSRNGSAPNPYHSYLGSDFRNAYVPGSTLDGAGQEVGLLEFDGFNSSDIVAYENLLPGSPRVPLQTVLLNGATGQAGSQNMEVCLDIEMALAMAPGLSKIVVFEGAGNLPNNILEAMASSNTVKNLSCSWAWTGGPNTTTENIFKTMAAQGQSFFNASGDADAYLPGAADNAAYTNYPSSSPNITQVGGTSLVMGGAGNDYVAESVWNPNNGFGSSGGVSSYNTLPVWQQGMNWSAIGGSGSHRNLPDVAMEANNVYVTCDNGSNLVVQGTSCAAPLWAGFMALVNQQAAADGNPAVGFVNPAIYALGKSPNYSFYFHDITTGSNAWSASPNQYFAAPGFDLCTGWGTPAGTNLINALAQPNPLQIAPLAGFNSTGPVGGPFRVPQFSIDLTNTGGTPLTWTISSPVSWLNVSPTSGTLAAGSGTHVSVTRSAAANYLPAANYLEVLAVTNLTSGIGQNVPYALEVGQSLVANGGFETGDYKGWTLADSSYYDGVSSNIAYLTPHSGAYCFTFGNANGLTLLSQSLATTPGQDYLISFWLSNPGGTGTGDTNKFQVNWNTNNAANNTILNLLNPSAWLHWIHESFVETATGTNTTLQFTAENSTYYFGLDDVSVEPIPAPSFDSAGQAGGGFQFTWNTLPGVAYQIEYATNLSSPHWMTLATRQATASISIFTNRIVGGKQRFFRIHQLP